MLDAHTQKQKQKQKTKKQSRYEPPTPCKWALPPVPSYANQSPQQNAIDPTQHRSDAALYTLKANFHSPQLLSFTHAPSSNFFFSNSQPQTRGEKEIKKNGHVRSGGRREGESWHTNISQNAQIPPSVQVFTILLCPSPLDTLPASVTHPGSTKTPLRQDL